jgi:predicted CXXCH cytochrome family protein
MHIFVYYSRLKRSGFVRLALLVVGLLIAAGAILSVVYLRTPQATSSGPVAIGESSPRKVLSGKHVTAWWDAPPAELRSTAELSGRESNINPADYVGPEACKECHVKNYESWSKHPHHWMNALANEQTVKGDFSGKAVMNYRGGQATFRRQDGKYLMRLERGDVRRTYAITQTIGSRFYQYYVGRLLEGPEPKGHPFYAKEHVLHLGYWIAGKEWVPTVRVGPELPDAERADPFDPPQSTAFYAEYAASCNYCHTTFPLGDLFARSTRRMGEHTPVNLHFSMKGYLDKTHPDKTDAIGEMIEHFASHPPAPTAGYDRNQGSNPLLDWEAPKYAVTLGISCEACHLGCKTHVESGGTIAPKFFPTSPYLSVEARDADLNFGRTHDNVNWACGRCHTGGRTSFAAGMATWNSVEFADAMRGGCYSKLRCIDCHNPHRAIGPKWQQTGEQDDAVCLKCHDKLKPETARKQHTHHATGSEGARCMNCHMPRINEGLQDVVRTHTIFSPTQPDMIQANNPNACNLCHTDRSIDWTLTYLERWYGATYDPAQIASIYARRDRPAALGWLKSKNQAVRLVAAEALTRAHNSEALPQLLGALDDPYLINRQFAQKGLEEMLHVRLGDYGYRFYMTSDERRGPLATLRARFQK